jgi:hypothetical protein
MGLDIVDGNSGTLMNGTTVAPGKVELAFEFDGFDDYIGGIGNPGNLHFAGREFTVMAWVRFTSLSRPPGSPAGPCGIPDCDMTLVSKFVPGGLNYDGWRLLKQSDNHIYWCFGDPNNGCAAGAATTVPSTMPVSAGAWYHIAGVKDTAELALYMNGVLDRAKPLPQIVDTDTADVVLGVYVAQSGSSFLYGLLDEVQIYSRALTAAEIAGVYAAGGAGTCVGVEEQTPTVGRPTIVARCLGGSRGCEVTISLPRRGQASLRVFDVAGRHVATLLDHALEAGVFSIPWDAGAARRAVPPGVYFLKLISEAGPAQTSIVYLR